MLVIVTGSRQFSDYPRLRSVLSSLAPTEVWTGDAAGADSLARVWARLQPVPVRVWRARWAVLGPRAGVVRSAEMLAAAPADSLVVAFPVGALETCRGTAACVRAARRRGLRVMVR